MDENASVSVAAIAVFVVVLAALWVPINSARDFLCVCSSLRSTQCTGSLFLFQIISRQFVVIHISILSSVDFGVEIA